MRSLLIVTGFFLALAPTAAWSFEAGRANGSSSNYWLAEPPRNLAPEEEIQSPVEMREAPVAEPPVALPVISPSPPPPLADGPSPEVAQQEPELIPSLAAPPVLGSGAPERSAPDLHLAPTDGMADDGTAPQLPPMP